MKKIMFNERFGLQQAVLDGTKTMTRRICTMALYRKLEDGTTETIEPDDMFIASDGTAHFQVGRNGYMVPKQNQPAYHVGEEVAIAQSYRDVYDEYLNDINNQIFDAYAKAKDEDVSGKGFENKMFVRADLMPHRIIIRKVDVQRIQDITDEDCTREGIQTDTKHFQEWQGQHGFRDRDKNVPLLFKSRREAFASLIAKVGKKSDWEDNPWVYVYTFDLLR
jgi:hypothetical protein